MHLLFDFDGTLVDSGELIYNRLKLRASHEISYQELRHLPSEKVIERLGISFLKLPFLIYDIRSEFQKNITSLPLVDGIKETLESLREQGHTLHIVSSNSTENIRVFLLLHQLQDYFLSVASLFTIFGKANGLRNLLNQKQIAYDQAVYIGDETRDIEAARQINIKSCAVCWGYNSEQVLTAFNPDFIAKTPNDLASILN